MEYKELDLTTEEAIRELEAFELPFHIADETVRAYKRGHMVGSTKAIKACLRDLIKRDLGW